MKNPKKQFEKYMKTCETVKNQFEVVVSKSFAYLLPLIREK